MARATIYEEAGAVYHVVAHGDGCKVLFMDDKPRQHRMNFRADGAAIA